MQHTSYSKLSPKDKKLLDTAEAMMKKSYAPYSHFTVGAALLSADGNIIGGANVENAAYGNSICAERAAVLAANAKGYRQFKSIAIIGKLTNAKSTSRSSEIVSPCGSCRQVLFEMARLHQANIKIIASSTTKKKIVISSIYNLLPLGFYYPKNVLG